MPLYLQNDLSNELHSSISNLHSRIDQVEDRMDDLERIISEHSAAFNEMADFYSLNWQIWKTNLGRTILNLGAYQEPLNLHIWSLTFNNWFLSSFHNYARLISS